MRLLLLLPALLAGCVSVPAHDRATPLSPLFSPQQFFLGRTEGVGTLRVLFSAPRAVRVHGLGRIGTDGSLDLDQTVQQAGKPDEHRAWRIREVGAGRYAGTLSSASGPIEAEASGNLLHLRFRMKNGLDAEQRLYLSADRQSARNVMTMRKFGLVVATLDETIRKVE